MRSMVEGQAARRSPRHPSASWGLRPTECHLIDAHRGAENAEEFLSAISAPLCIIINQVQAEPRKRSLAATQTPHLRANINPQLPFHSHTRNG